MKGATAEPSVSTISTESRSIVTMMGPSHHFFRTRMNAHSSPKIVSRSRKPPVERAICHLLPCGLGALVELEPLPPVEVLPELGLLPLPEDLVAEHEDVHVRPHEAEVGVVRS